MHFADYTVILVLALILFGPKKLPEIARQIGKLMVEFRRASNEFKAQIEDELRAMEQQDRQKKLEAAAAQAPALTASAETAEENVDMESRPVVLPPSIGEIVSAEPLTLPVASQDLLDAAEVDPHPVYAEALASESQGTHEANHNTLDHPGTGLAPGPESEQASVNHG